MRASNGISNNMHAVSASIQRTHTWPRWPYLLFLSILFLGPPAAALCIASGVPFLTMLGWTARDVLTTYVCPTPLKSYELFAAPMAVCTRCWGATIGLWAGWYIATNTARRTATAPWFAFPVVVRFMTALAPFCLWWLEIHYWPTASYEVLLLNGALAGTTAGMFFCSIWPGMRPRG